ncbi:uncharacterized protein LOC125740748 isoform X2 [Brienomyrus brachyistius]|uniref:uncharacterized protein LOC125740748 isoform X2 n=1 Tax=Brienomyrus brachyistius TaxID=42636 RepID=UPI0020B3D197|nr:uncharacterized protein LOC125740748 isoform X2 [Brienomyrus brachyistius]
MQPGLALQRTAMQPRALRLTGPPRGAALPGICCMEKDVVLEELVHSRSWLNEVNAELQKSVDLAEVNITTLRSEMGFLRSQVKSMEWSVAEAEELTEELEEVRAHLAQQGVANSALQMTIRRLEKENESLKEHIESVTAKMACMLPQTEMDKERFASLRGDLQLLQDQMDEMRLALLVKEELIQKKDFMIEELESSLDEYAIIAQDLKEKIRELEQHQEEAVICSSGAFQPFNGMFSPPTAPCVCLSHELRLQPPHSTQTPLPESFHETPSGPQEETDFEEEEAMDEREREPPVEPAPPEPLLKRQEVPCWRWPLQAVAAVALGLISLGMITITMPGCLDSLVTSCSNGLRAMGQFILQPHCSLHHADLPPI